MKTGKSNLLKLLNENFIKSPQFELIVIKSARDRFSELRLKREKYEGKITEIKTKRFISPIILVLILKPELLQEILNEFFDICNEGAAYFDSKLEGILQQIIKSKDQVRNIVLFLFEKFNLDPTQIRITNLIRRIINVSKSHSSYYKTFIQCLFDFHKNDRDNFNRLLPFLEVQVLFDFMILTYENNIEYFVENLKNIYTDWKIKVEDFFKYAAFTDRQFTNASLCSKFCNDLIAWNLNNLNLRAIYNHLHEEFLKKEYKDPNCFPVMLAYIAYKFAIIDKERGNSIDFYLNIFREGITQGQLNNPVFWGYLVSYCRLDKIVSETGIRNLIPDTRQKDFIMEVNMK